MGNNFKKLEDGAFVEFLLLLVFIDFAHFQSSRGQRFAPTPFSGVVLCVCNTVTFFCFSLNSILGSQSPKMILLSFAYIKVHSTAEFYEFCQMRSVVSTTIVSCRRVSVP